MTTRSIHTTASKTALGRYISENGIRRPWLADQLGLDNSYVYRWCTGERPIPEHRLQQMADLFRVDVEVLR